MKKRWRPRSLTALTFLTTLFAAILWLISMGCLTIAVAQTLLTSLYSKSADFTESLNASSRLGSVFEDVSGLPGAVEYRIWQALEYGQRGRSHYILTNFDGESSSFGVLREKAIPLQTAVAFYDADGRPLYADDSFLYFPYVTEAAWKAGQDSPTEGYARAVIDLDTLLPREGRLLELNNGYLDFEYRAMRFTGVLEGTELAPERIEYISDDQWRNALDEAGPTATYWDKSNQSLVSEYNYTFTELEEAGLLEWETMYQAPQPPAGEQITLYTTYPRLAAYEPGEKVLYEDMEFDTLRDLLQNRAETVLDTSDYITNCSRGSLKELILFSNQFFHAPAEIHDSSTAPYPLRFTMFTAVRSQPLAAAISALRNVYIGTFLLMLLGLLALRSSMKENLSDPLSEIDEAFSSGQAYLFPRMGAALKWREPHELACRLEETQDRIQMYKNEQTRLKTALDYAKRAEENRRQTTSHLAHELKTPIAVIHSYSEGLKEHIAEGKRDQYLDIILSESERLDGMVMEMLDLSRLEAGKVRLSRDSFSLEALARSAFEKLALRVQEKDLTLQYNCGEGCTVLADEARMAQVITNLATNAVKYTPTGGRIQVSAESAQGGVRFTVENDSSSLSEETLSRAWDSFYRSENARTEEGSGLGLAITKQIVELHGGKCFARNTRTGVVFGFFLPQ